MSDFDKEAERQKLREQFADDEADREHTERMSELLLQGATMTNKHCDTCGDPIFRHDGQEFCPTCQAGGQAQQQTEQAEQARQTEQTQRAQQQTGQAQERAEPVQRPDDQPTESGTGGAEDASQSAAGTAGETANEQRPGPEATQPPSVDRRPPATDGQVDAAGRSEANTAPRQPTRQSADGLSEAREALVRTVTRLAREAETSDDLGRTREYLAGAKEAAEALAAVRQAER